MIDEEVMKIKARALWPHKSMIVAYLLWFFFGVFGIHRLYLCWNKTGTLMLICVPLGFLTAGVSFIIPFSLYIIDLFYTYSMVKDFNAYQDKGYIYELEKLARNT